MFDHFSGLAFKGLNVFLFDVQWKIVYVCFTFVTWVAISQKLKSSNYEDKWVLDSNLCDNYSQSGFGGNKLQRTGWL